LLISTSTQEDAVVVQLSARVEVAPLLGAHHWRTFWLHPRAVTSPGVSHIFQYNWKSNGDPGNSSLSAFSSRVPCTYCFCFIDTEDWEFAIPTSELPPPDFVVLDPYPDPVWAQRPQNLFYRSLTLAMPPPQPPPAEIQPPPPLPNASPRIPRDSIEAQAPKLYIDKRDPYEQGTVPQLFRLLDGRLTIRSVEEAAELLLRAPETSINNSFAVKAEPRNGKSCRPIFFHIT
jgi:hypothetical protein